MDAHGIEHNLALASSSCKWCLGTGVQATVVTGKQRACTICRCVSVAEAQIARAASAPPVALPGHGEEH